MLVTNAQASRSADIGREIDHARSRGPLQRIVIPPCPELLVRLRAAMAEPEADLNEVARIAAGDVAMSATLLRNANGPRFAGSQPAHTVGQAMNRLGLDETAAIMTGFLARHAIPADHPRLRRFWEQSRLRAQAMAFIARQLAGLSPDLAHTYGLFCHVGLPVLLQGMRGYAGTLVEAAARVDRSFIATENANHQTDHAVVGALVVRVWRLAPEVMAAIRLHHDPQVLGDEATEPEVRTLVAAGLVAEHVMRRREGLPSESDWEQHSASALAWLGIGEDDLGYWRDEMEIELDAA
ncbi:MAG: HDOD domain-containing protein [Burkholderiales bacterium]|nr:HDOD domain-containing protein [Burkholderiales bacterium]MDE2396926.1 HDOD domain-containing protein [Burkholderiales bacterium]MDE2457537.1 HDOD domain-containing protein [Burkholderiales bacterium]